MEFKQQNLKFHGIPWNFVQIQIPWNSMELFPYSRVPWNSMELDKFDIQKNISKYCWYLIDDYILFG